MKYNTIFIYDTYLNNWYVFWHVATPSGKIGMLFRKLAHQVETLARLMARKNEKLVGFRHVGTQICWHVNHASTQARWHADAHDTRFSKLEFHHCCKKISS